MTETDEDLEVGRRRSPATIIIAVVVTLALLAGFGGIGYFTGTGWFGYRQLLYGTGEVYLLNLSDQPLEAFVDGRGPVEIVDQGADVAEIIGGDSTVTVQTPAGERLDTIAVHVEDSDALVKLSEDGCLVASDISGFYGGAKQSLEVIETIEADQQVWVAGSTNVTWPRHQFPKQLHPDEGPPIWVEIVACDLLDQPEFLRAYLDVRLRDRMGASDEVPTRRGPP